MAAEYLMMGFYTDCVFLALDGTKILIHVNTRDKLENIDHSRNLEHEKNNIYI